MSRKVLVVDDDTDILAIIGFVLEEEGYQPILLQTGPTDEYVSELDPELILLDVRISGYPKTGAEICSELKSNAAVSHIPIVLVSAEHNLNTLAQNCGANGFVNKPFDIQRIVDTVKEFLS